MGRKTWDSLGGKPLPNRRNIVLSRSLASAPGAEVIGAPEDLGSLGLEGEVFIIGGQKIYEIFLPQCETLYLTAVRGDFPGDAFFPPFEDAFALDQVEMATPAFEIRVYRRR
ncbi:MAG: dihydrofolate reductase [Verrucomicrobiales bacterium]